VQTTQALPGSSFAVAAETGKEREGRSRCEVKRTQVFFRYATAFLTGGAAHVQRTPTNNNPPNGMHAAERELLPTIQYPQKMILPITP
jgi:hypothetical protein